MEAISGGSSGDDDGRSLLSSSVHKVLLPLLSLHLFKRVSKHWQSLITSPSFRLRRTQISGFDPPSGLFIQRDVVPSAYDFLSFDSRKLGKKSIVFTYNLETYTKPLIEQSCNGLLLCRVSDKHFVYNPLINMFKILPPIHPLNYFHSSRSNVFKMAFDPTKSPSYKVVHVGSILNAAGYGWSVKIQTYSSETGVWSVWDDRFHPSSFFGFMYGIYWNGAIHWLNNSNDPFHFKLEIVDRLVLTNLQTPLTVEGKVHHHCKLFGSYGSLRLLCEEHRNSPKLKIYEMKNGCSEWSIKYFVNLDDMLLRRKWKLPKHWGPCNVWSIFFGEREEDSFMVIELSGKLLHYKFVSATVTKLLDVGKGGCYGHDFIPSFAHV